MRKSFFVTETIMYGAGANTDNGIVTIIGMFDTEEGAKKRLETESTKCLERDTCSDIKCLVRVSENRTILVLDRVWRSWQVIEFDPAMQKCCKTCEFLTIDSTNDSDPTYCGRLGIEHEYEWRDSPEDLADCCECWEKRVGNIKEEPYLYD